MKRLEKREVASAAKTALTLFLTRLPRLGISYANIWI